MLGAHTDLRLCIFQVLSAVRQSVMKQSLSVTTLMMGASHLKGHVTGG